MARRGRDGTTWSRRPELPDCNYPAVDGTSPFCFRFCVRVNDGVTVTRLNPLGNNVPCLAQRGAEPFARPASLSPGVVVQWRRVALAATECVISSRRQMERRVALAEEVCSPMNGS